MQNIRRSVTSSKSRWGGFLRSFLESRPRLDGFSSSAKRFPADWNSSFTRQFATGANNMSMVKVRIGHPITGNGQESRNRAAWQRIPNRIYTNENGVEHVEVNFYICGPHGAGRVFTEMFKDKTDNKWKYTYLIVQINSLSRAELMLGSYLPAAELRSSAAN